MADPPVTFAALLRKLRTGARLTQEELAEAASMSPRSVSDLERGVSTAPRKDTVRLLADALRLTGPARAEFEAVARGRVPEGSDAGGGAAAATRTLPRDIASFTGRQYELHELVAAAADAAAGAGGVVGIHAIGGMAGVGKTAFAVHAAHRLADRFPGGQIFLPLHGHTPGQQPVDPEDALASLLLTIGVSAAQIPPHLEARMALWRDRLAERQLLLILDDAASSDQVRPLLPGSSGSLVLVTSRRHLSALEDATAISLDTLPPDDAAALLVRLAARPGLGASDPAVGDITRLCGYLPLAIGMLARQLHHHPAWTLTGRAADLAAARDRLELMATENLSVAAAFDLSYADLGEDQQRLFRRLGLHPGTDIDAYAAAALDGTDLATGRRQLEALYDHYLITEPTAGRYRLHDLIREHARALAARDDPAERDQAIEGLLDYYQHTATLAESHLARQSRTRSTTPAPSSDAPDLPDSTRALAWARAERASLLACLDHATESGQQARVVALTAAVAALLRLDGPWTDAVARHTAARQAARQIGDRLGEADALNELAVGRRLTDDYPGAAQALAEAMDIYRDLGHRLGQANVGNNLGIGRLQTDDFPGAVQALGEALDIYRDLGDRLGQANALKNLASARSLTDDLAGAVRAGQEALGLYRDLGDWLGQAGALTELGILGEFTGDFPAAVRALAEALDIYRDLGDRLGQANTLTDLGIIRQASADYPGAADALAEALDISRDLGDRFCQANALTYLGELRRLTGDHSGAARLLDEALVVWRGIGNRLGQANALLYLGYVRRQAGEYPDAARLLDEALGLYLDVGDRLGQTVALTGLAGVRRLTGDYPGAARALEEALDICRDAGFRGGELSEALDEAGTLHRVSGELSRAVDCHREALDAARERGSVRDEACALAGLARCALVAGRTADAIAGLRQAQEIFQRIGAAEAADVTAELEALTGAGPAA